LALDAYFLNQERIFRGRYDEVRVKAKRPNHIHILFKETNDLGDVMRVLKGGSSYKINKSLNQKGNFWANDYYDKLIRDEKHFEVVYNYIKNNPLKAGLKDSKERFYGIYE